MDYIAKWFPFTLVEVHAAFMAEGLSTTEADVAATSLAQEFAQESEGSSFTEYDGGRWLDAIAALSEDAAHRVERFRQYWGPPRSGIWEVVVRDEK